MRLRRRHRSCPNAGPVSCTRGVTGATKELGEAVLARHLPNRAGERPIFLLAAWALCRGSTHGVMLLQFAWPVVGAEHPVALRAAHVFMPGHVLHLAQIVPL